MRLRVLRWLAKRLPLRTIEVAGDEYLRRYYVCGRLYKPGFPDAKPLFGFLPWIVYLHHFIRPDKDRELHNHPFNAVSLILTGGYNEHRLENGEVVTNGYRPGNINVITTSDFHTVDKLSEVEDTWTLFICGRKTQTWGFRMGDGSFLQNRDFFARTKDE